MKIIFCLLVLAFTALAMKNNNKLDAVAACRSVPSCVESCQKEMDTYLKNPTKANKNHLLWCGRYSCGGVIPCLQNFGVALEEED